MALKDLIAQHASSVFLNPDHFAEEITRHPLGDLTGEAAVLVTANVTYGSDPSADRNRINVTVEESEEIGRANRQVADLTIACSVTVDLQDHWTIDALKFVTVSIGRPQGGLRMVRVQRVDLVARKTGFGNLE